MTLYNWVSGYSLKFIKTPCQEDTPLNNKFSQSETILIKKEIDELLRIKAVESCIPTKDQFCSSIFLVQKPNGEYRFILNLKKLNQFMLPEHFKLEDYRTVCKLIQKDDNMATIDLKNAYYMIKIDLKYRKYLRFYNDGKLYQFTVLPFGLCTAPFLFTKIFKPILSVIRKRGIRVVQYLDDTCIIAKSYSECKNQVNYILNLFENLGFLVNYKKCNIIPKTECKFLGFIFNSEVMIISIDQEKRLRVIELLSKLKHRISIRFLAKF